MKKFFLFAMMAVYASMAFAQINPKAGFVITLENDTLWGDIDFRTDESNMEKCRFRPEGRERWTTFTPEQINGYRITDNGKFYVSRFLPIKSTRTLCFVEYMLKGEMNLYYVPVGERYFFVDKNNKIVEYNYDFDDRLDNSEEYEKILQPLRKMMKDSPSALAKISPYKMYREQLIDIARAYHNDVCTSNEDCIEFTYDKKADKTKLHYRIFAGGMYCPSYQVYDYPGNMISYATPAFGVGLDIDLPRVAKNLTAQVQVTYCMESEKNGILKASNDREFEYKSETSHLLFEAGAAYALKDKGVIPVLRAGVSVDKMAEEMKSIITNPTHEGVIFGGYAGAGVEAPVGKFAITFDVTGRLMLGCKSKCMIMATAGIKL